MGRVIRGRVFVRSRYSALTPFDAQKTKYGNVTDHEEGKISTGGLFCATSVLFSRCQRYALPRVLFWLTIF